MSAPPRAARDRPSGAARDRPPAPLVAARPRRTSPPITVVPPRRLRRRLEGTRAHRPKAEHAGRTTPRPRGGNCFSPQPVTRQFGSQQMGRKRTQFLQVWMRARKWCVLGEPSAGSIREISQI